MLGRIFHNVEIGNQWWIVSVTYRWWHDIAISFVMAFNVDLLNKNWARVLVWDLDLLEDLNIFVSTRHTRVSPEKGHRSEHTTAETDLGIYIYMVYNAGFWEFEKKTFHHHLGHIFLMLLWHPSIHLPPPQPQHSYPFLAPRSSSASKVRANIM